MPQGSHIKNTLWVNFSVPLGNIIPKEDPRPLWSPYLCEVGEQSSTYLPTIFQGNFQGLYNLFGELVLSYIPTIQLVWGIFQESDTLLGELWATIAYLWTSCMGPCCLCSNHHCWSSIDIQLCILCGNYSFIQRSLVINYIYNHMRVCKNCMLCTTICISRCKLEINHVIYNNYSLH